MHLDLRIRGGFKAAYEARHSLAELAEHVPRETFDTVVLLINELVTNAVRHGRVSSTDEIGVEARLEPSCLRVRVTDMGTRSQIAQREPSLDEGSGWGLNLVERLSDRWGFAQKDTTEVWFEIDLP